VTGELGGKTEVLIANRYYLAQTSLRFEPGAVLTLLLSEARPDLYVFRVLGQSDASASLSLAFSDADAALARLGIAPDTDTLAAARALLAAGAPLTSDSVALFARLAQASGPAKIPMLATIYAALVSEGASPDLALMGQVASYLAGGAALGSLLARLERAQRRMGLRSADFFKALFIEEDFRDADGIRLLADLLHTPVEASIARSLKSEAPSAAATGSHAISAAADIPAEFSEGDEIELLAVTVAAQLEALAVVNSVSEDSILLELPVRIGGNSVSLLLDYRREPPDGYDERYTALLGLDAPSLGRIEAIVRKRGARMEVEIMASDENTLALLSDIANETCAAKSLASATGSASVDIEFSRLARPAIIEEGE
jgi:hypothetical protein